MSGYVYGLVCASAAIGIAELLIPQNAKTGRYLGLLFSLALLLAVVRPLGELVRALPGAVEELIIIEQPSEDYEKIADGALADAYGQAISAELRSSFGLSDFEVGVVLDEERRPQKITVILMGKDIFRDPYKIEAHLGGAFGCECVAVIG